MSKYGDLDKVAERILARRRAATREQQQGSLSFAPSKKRNKVGVAKASERQDNKLLSSLPGGRGEMGIIKMIASPHTGCKVADDETKGRLAQSAVHANTTQGNYVETVEH